MTDPIIYWESERIENPITGKELKLPIFIQFPEEKKLSIEEYLK